MFAFDRISLILFLLQNLPLVKSLLDKDQDGDDKGKKKKKGKGKSGNERKKPCPAYLLWCKDQWAEVPT